MPPAAVLSGLRGAALLLHCVLCNLYRLPHTLGHLFVLSVDADGDITAPLDEVQLVRRGLLQDGSGRARGWSSLTSCSPGPWG